MPARTFGWRPGHRSVVQDRCGAVSVEGSLEGRDDALRQARRVELPDLLDHPDDPTGPVWIRLVDDPST